jgi:predicted nucleic acid-binding protein
MPETRVVISNTTLLLHLDRIGRLELLKTFYGQILVTPAVVAELEAGGAPALNLRQLDWVAIREVRIPEALKLVPDLGAGEASTIALALELPVPSLVLMDDRLGRRIAALHGLKVTGTAGFLIRAKQRGLIPAIKPVLDELIGAGFYLRPRHMDDLCRLAGE